MKDILTKLIICNSKDENEVYIRGNVIEWDGDIDLEIKELNLYTKLSNDIKILQMILKSITEWQSYMNLKFTHQIITDITKNMILESTLEHFMDLEVDSDYKLKVKMGSDL